MSRKKSADEPSFFQPFQDLKNIIKRRELRTSDIPVVADNNPVNEDELFADAMREVREIKEFRRIPVRRKKVCPLPVKIPSDRKVMQVLEEIVNGQRPVDLPVTQEYVEWLNQDYRVNILRKLHEGKFSVRDYLDLHGFDVKEAEAEVSGFLKESLRKGHRCVKIIHGRGLRSPAGPVLKEALIQWLSGRYRKHIVAFVTARQCDGGLGALYVLLR